VCDLRDIAAEAVDEIIRGRGERPFPPRLSLKGKFLKSQCPSIFPRHTYRNLVSKNNLFVTKYLVTQRDFSFFDVFFACV
jgi:hypothetical protein